MTDAGARSGTWWGRGATARPWLHALTAAVVGAAAAHATYVGAVLLFLAGGAALFGLLAVVAVTGAVLSVVAAVGARRRRAAWVGLVALVLVPAVLVVQFAPTFLGADSSASGALGPSPSPLAYGVGAAIAAVPVLLLHPGPARALGSTGVLSALVVVVVVAAQAHGGAVERDQEAIARAQVAIGADFRPVTVSPSGYGSIFEANIEKRLPGFLQVFSSPASRGHAPGQTSGDDLTVVTVAADTAVCGRPLEGVGPDGAGEAETSCRVGRDLSHRASAHGQEVSAVVGDTLVAVSARKEVDAAVLEEAVRSAEPIGDQAYRHVLLGDGDEYTDELDGNRCPITGVVCG